MTLLDAWRAVREVPWGDNDAYWNHTHSRQTIRLQILLDRREDQIKVLARALSAASVFDGSVDASEIDAILADVEKEYG